jgi:LDH2 family malate/lactate/ureidoglycolate dehydrogenase
MKAKTTVGLWIDHRKAVIVFLTGTGQEEAEEEIKQISSDLEHGHGQAGASVRADDLLQREMTEHLNRYYDEVIASLRHAETILILGPGEAKGELKKRLEKNHVNGREIKVETVDKLTDRQIVAKVKERFIKKR